MIEAATAVALLGFSAAQIDSMGAGLDAEAPCATCATGCIISGECILRDDSDVEAMMTGTTTFEEICSTFGGDFCPTFSETQSAPSSSPDLPQYALSDCGDCPSGCWFDAGDFCSPLASEPEGNKSPEELCQDEGGIVCPGGPPAAGSVSESPTQGSPMQPPPGPDDDTDMDGHMS